MEVQVGHGSEREKGNGDSMRGERGGAMYFEVSLSKICGYECDNVRFISTKLYMYVYIYL